MEPFGEMRFRVILVRECKRFFFLPMLLSHTLAEARGALVVLFRSQENAGAKQPSAHHQNNGYLSQP